LIDLSKDIEPNLEKYKKVFQEEYSKELLDVIEKCLNLEPNSRPTFDQLK
jgi:serine/threonine protein kinase